MQGRFPREPHGKHAGRTCIRGGRRRQHVWSRREGEGLAIRRCVSTASPSEGRPLSALLIPVFFVASSGQGIEMGPTGGRVVRVPGSRHTMLVSLLAKPLVVGLSEEVFIPSFPSPSIHCSSSRCAIVESCGKDSASASLLISCPHPILRVLGEKTLLRPNRHHDDAEGVPQQGVLARQRHARRAGRPRGSVGVVPRLVRLPRCV